MNPALGRQYKTFEGESPVTQESLEDNYKEYADNLDKTPSYISPILSKQKTRIGEHTGPGTTVESWAGLKTTKKEVVPAKDEDFTIDKAGLEHKLQYVHSYSISSYVKSRPQLAIFEVPLLRRKFNT